LPRKVGVMTPQLLWERRPCHATSVQLPIDTRSRAAVELQSRRIRVAAVTSAWRSCTRFLLQTAFQILVSCGLFAVDVELQREVTHWPHELRTQLNYQRLFVVVIVVVKCPSLRRPPWRWRWWGWWFSFHLDVMCHLRHETVHQCHDKSSAAANSDIHHSALFSRKPNII